MNNNGYGRTRERLNSNGRRRSAVRGLLGAGLAIIIVWLAWPQEQLLLNVAHPVVELALKSEKSFWLSPHQLLLLTTLQEAYDGGNPNSARPPQVWQGSADLVDTTTHIHTPLIPLTTLLNQTGVQPESFLVNPFGPGLFWKSTRDHALMCMAFPDGSHSRQWRRNLVKQEFYADARHFLQTTDKEPMVVVYDLLDLAQDRKYAQMEDARTVFMQYYARSPIDIQLNSSLTGPKGDVEIETYRMRTDIPLHFSSAFPDSGPQQFLERQALKLPPGTTLSQGWPSPQQTALVYDLEIVRPSLLPVWLHRFFLKSQIEPRVTEGLWGSRADGQGLREIGHVPAPPDRWGHPKAILSNLHWLPDGKQVSFVYAGMLSIVPAEPEK